MLSASITGAISGKPYSLSLSSFQLIGPFAAFGIIGFTPSGQLEHCPCTDSLIFVRRLLVRVNVCNC